MCASHAPACVAPLLGEPSAPTTAVVSDMFEPPAPSPPPARAFTSSAAAASRSIARPSSFVSGIRWHQPDLLSGLTQQVTPASMTAKIDSVGK